MRRLVNTVAAVSVLVVLAGSLASCSNGEKKATPKLPKRVCWDAFAGSDVSPILATGEEVSVRHGDFVLIDDLDSVTCDFYVDGTWSVVAGATLYYYESLIDYWGSMGEANPRPIGVGKKGIVWRGGAATYFTCESPRRKNSSGRYVQLMITVDRVPDKSKLPTVLPKLLRKYMEFTRHELKCEAEA